VDDHGSVGRRDAREERGGHVDGLGRQSRGRRGTLWQFNIKIAVAAEWGCRIEQGLAYLRVVDGLAVVHGDVKVGHIGWDWGRTRNIKGK